MDLFFVSLSNTQETRLYLRRRELGLDEECLLFVCPHLLLKKNLTSKLREEDIHVVESQDPEQIPHPREEIAVPADKVSLSYRRCLYDLCHAKAEGPETLNTYLNTPRDDI